jgi:hypothetical protein
VDCFFATADGQRKAAVRVKLDPEAGRAAVAVQACEHALEEGAAAWDDVRNLGHPISW